MPPGSGKSIYASVLFPPWLLSNEAESPNSCRVYNTQLASQCGRRVRNSSLITAWYWGFRLRERQSREIAGNSIEAATTMPWVRVPAPPGPLDFVIIDDPIGAREDADSQRVRDKIWDWYKADVSPRMKPAGRRILI